MKEATGAHFSFWHAHLAKESGQISDSRVWNIVVNIKTIETRVLSQGEEERGKRLGTSVSSPELPSKRDGEGGDFVGIFSIWCSLCGTKQIATCLYTCACWCMLTPGANIPSTLSEIGSLSEPGPHHFG